MKGFEELAGLRLKEADLSAQQERLNQPAPDQPEPLPPFIPKFLTLLFVAGLGVAVIGLIQAAAMDVFAGLGMGFIGFCGLGIAWGFRHHLDAHTRRATATEGDQPEQLDAELAETRAAIARLTANPQTDASSESAPDDAELHRQAIARLAELERWNRTKRGLRARRRRLSELRARARRACSAI